MTRKPNIKFAVISRENRPLAALYPPPIKVNALYSAAISSFALNFRSQGRYAHAYGICLLYLISVKIKYTGGITLVVSSFKGYCQVCTRVQNFVQSVL